MKEGEVMIITRFEGICPGSKAAPTMKILVLLERLASDLSLFIHNLHVIPFASSYDIDMTSKVLHVII